MGSGGDSVLKAGFLLGTVIALDPFIWYPKGKEFFPVYIWAYY